MGRRQQCRHLYHLKDRAKVFQPMQLLCGFFGGGLDYTDNQNLGVNTLTTHDISSTDPEDYPMYSPDVTDTGIDFSFFDVILNKRYGKAIFKRPAGTDDKLIVTMKNSEMMGRFGNEPPYNVNFTLPNNILLTKE